LIWINASEGFRQIIFEKRPQSARVFLGQIKVWEMTRMLEGIDGRLGIGFS
jgi:hypothetical protein